MYLRPGNLAKDFWIEKKATATTTYGRTTGEYGEGSAEHVLAVLAGATTAEIERFKQIEHPISHTITHWGRPKAVEGDRLIHGSRVFYIQGVDDPGDVGVCTIYYAEERSDADERGS